MPHLYAAAGADAASLDYTDDLVPTIDKLVQLNPKGPAQVVVDVVPHLENCGAATEDRSLQRTEIRNPLGLRVKGADGCLEVSAVKGGKCLFHDLYVLLRHRLLQPGGFEGFLAARKTIGHKRSSRRARVDRVKWPIDLESATPGPCSQPTENEDLIAAVDESLWFYPQPLQYLGMLSRYRLTSA